MPTVALESNEEVTSAFAAPTFHICSFSRNASSGVSHSGYALQLDAGAISVTTTIGAPDSGNILYEDAYLRPDAADLFNSVAEALFPDIEI